MAARVSPIERIRAQIDDLFASNQPLAEILEHVARLRLLGKHLTKTNALESLVIAAYVRGLSTRDVEASLAEALGSEATLSRSTVSRICQQVKDDQTAVKADFWRIFPDLLVHLRFPAEHWSRIRHSNLIERTFGETRRRVKVIGRLPGEQSCLSLVWAVLDRAARSWRGVDQRPANVRLLQQLRRGLLDPVDVPEPATTAA